MERRHARVRVLGRALLLVLAGLVSGVCWAGEEPADTLSRDLDRSVGGATSVACLTRTVEGVSVRVIIANMNSPRVKVTVEPTRYLPGGDESFMEMVRRSRATAAVAGTFFDKYTRIPIGDIVVDGKVRHEGRMATAMAITPDNKVAFGRVVWGHSADWTGYETVLEAGPTLIKSGQIDLKPQQERFRDPHVLGSGVRGAVGLTNHNKLVIATMSRGVTLRKLAQIMKRMGCVEAMNLDGGASLAMYFRGKVLQSPGRRLTNLLVVQENAQHVALADPPRYAPEGNGGHPRLAARAIPGEELAAVGIERYPGSDAGDMPGWADGPPLYTTKDTFDKVVAFYKHALGARAEYRVFGDEQERTALLKVTSGQGAGAMVQVFRRAKGPTLMVCSTEGMAVPSHCFP